MKELQFLLDQGLAKRHSGVSCIVLNTDYRVIATTEAISSFGLDSSVLRTEQSNYIDFIHLDDKTSFVTKLRKELHRENMRVYLTYRQSAAPNAVDYEEVAAVVYRLFDYHMQDYIYPVYLLRPLDKNFFARFAEACEMQIDLTYKLSLSQIDVPVVMTQQYRICFANSAAAQLLHYEPSELYGMRMEHFVRQRERDTMNKRLQRQYDGQHFSRFICAAQCKNGELLEVESTGCALYIDQQPTTLAAMVDVTEHNRNRDNLRLLYQAMREIDDGVLITDLEMQITWLNRAAGDMLGLGFEEAMGLSLSTMQARISFEQAYSRVRSSLLGNATWNGILWHEEEGEKSYPVEVNVTTLFNENGAAYRYVFSMRDITDRFEKERLASEQAEYDNLTGLHNHTYFLHALAERIQISSLLENKLHLILLDLDRFSVINNIDGYEIGDEILRLVAMRLRGFVGDDSRLARLGDDSFVILVEGTDPFSYAEMLAQLFEFPVYAGEKQYRITASIGMATYPNHANSGDKLITYARVAAMRGTNSWKTSANMFNESMLQTRTTFNPLENDLHSAIEKQDFRFFYQPKIDIATNAVVGCEALIRWFHDTKGMISPGEFIPLAEETGLIVPLGYIALEMACAQLQQWEKQGVQLIPISVNLSSNQLMESSFVSKVKELLSYYDVQPQYLELEVTEYVAMNHDVMVIEAFHKLEEMGILVSIDDFGTGYSSLGQLTKFPVHVIKIDRSFITDIENSPNSRSIVQAVILMSHSLGMKTVAEGVETYEQLEILRELNCDEVQGFYFSRPVPPEEFAHFLKDNVS